MYQNTRIRIIFSAKGGGGRKKKNLTDILASNNDRNKLSLKYRKRMKTTGRYIAFYEKFKKMEKYTECAEQNIRGE